MLFKFVLLHQWKFPICYSPNFKEASPEMFGPTWSLGSRSTFMGSSVHPPFRERVPLHLENHAREDGVSIRLHSRTHPLLLPVVIRCSTFHVIPRAKAMWAETL